MGAKTPTLVWLCTVIIVGSGCATIMNGRTQAVTVSSEPPGAHIFMGSQLLGVTPARLELTRRDDHIALRFEKDGFVGQEIQVKRSVSGWIAGNGGTLLAIDFLTGAAFKHPGVVRVILPPSGVRAEPARPVH